MNSGDKPRFVISPSGGRYVVMQGVPGKLDYVRLGSLERHGDRLSGTIPVSTVDSWVMTFSLTGVPGKMTLTAAGTNLSAPLRRTLTKLSDSTATPTPVP
jgi:hypothetical protein